jgi:hypothetical protein
MVAVILIKDPLATFLVSKAWNTYDDYITYIFHCLKSNLRKTPFLW